MFFFFVKRLSSRIHIQRKRLYRVNEFLKVTVYSNTRRNVLDVIYQLVESFELNF